jgi:hypothetical protein
MYIEEYEIVSLGTKYTGKNHNTEKKNQVLTHLHSEDGIHSKELLNLIESFDDSIHRHEGKTCKIIVEFRETNR